MFKVGDKVRCINPGKDNGLTLGKTYTLTGVSDMKPSEFGSECGWVTLVNDNEGYPVGVYGFRFELVEDKPFVNGYVYYTEWDDSYRIRANLSDVPDDALWVWELGDELVKRVTWEKKDA